MSLINTQLVEFRVYGSEMPIKSNDSTNIDSMTWFYFSCSNKGSHGVKVFERFKRKNRFVLEAIIMFRATENALDFSVLLIGISQVEKSVINNLN